MIILLHILIALTSLVVTTWLVIRPSRGRFTASYSLIAATLVSGTYLALTSGRIQQTCLTGLVYLVVAGGEVATAHYRTR